MNNYRIYFTCSDGFQSYEDILGANRLAAIETFETFNLPDVIDIECVRYDEF